jgi:signal transduction histidine kinase
VDVSGGGMAESAEQPDRGGHDLPADDVREADAPLRNREPVAETLAMVAQELRSPLGAVRGYAAELVRAIDASEVDPSLTETARQVERSLELVSLMLDRLRDSWTPGGELQLHLEAADLNELVDETVTDVAMTLAADHPVDVRHPVESTPIAVDVPRIRQILFNLISNAATYSEPGTPLVVTTRVVDDRIVIEVRNHGFGVASAEIERVFDRFTAVDHTAGSGLGIGLWLSRAIARAHGGDLRAEPEDVEGSRFVLELPRRPADHLPG